MDPLIGLGIVSGIGGLASSLAGNKMAFNQSKQLMDYQYELQQKAIDAQNLYNSPAEQMKRLSDANLNANLVYGSGVDGNQSSAANPSLSNRSVDIANPLQDIEANYRASRLLDIQEKNAETERAYTAAKTVGQLLNNTFADKSLEDRLKTVAAKLANVLEDTNLKSSNISLNASKANNLQELTRKYASEVDLNKAKTVVEKMKPSEVMANIKYIRAKTAESNSRTAVNKKQLSVMDSIINMNDAKAQSLINLAVLYSEDATNTYEKTVFQRQLNKIGAGNMTQKDKVKTLVDIARIMAGMYSGMTGAGASVAKAAL